MKYLCLFVALAMIGCGSDLCDCGEGQTHGRGDHDVRWIPEDNTTRGITFTDNIPFAHEPAQDIGDGEGPRETPSPR